ncbi:Uncharacterised protein [Mobiluncus curtisii subsp. curtisii]|nr:Uncharacterised protein [Mobiluncus curtisii subsp. curtisii]STY89881.1 Uncharacterised protein [Mobiluncus holmesii]
MAQSPVSGLAHTRALSDFATCNKIAQSEVD